MLTVTDLEQRLPAQFKKQASQELCDLVNNMITDPDIAENFRNNFLSYASVLKDGKYKIGDYANAVAYVGYKHMGMSNKDAYVNTFPQRYAALVASGKKDNEVAAYVSMYNKNKLVQTIMEQSFIPMWLINQDAYQKAINTQVTLMTTAQSELVRTQAANSILTHLAKPKEVAAKLDINISGNSDGLNELNETLARLGGLQQELIRAGASPKQIAESDIIDVSAK